MSETSKVAVKVGVPEQGMVVLSVVAEDGRSDVIEITWMDALSLALTLGAVSQISAGLLGVEPETVARVATEAMQGITGQFPTE